MPTPCRI